MSSDFEQGPERLSAGTDADARELVRSALADAPSVALREASVSRVLAEYARQRARQRRVWSGFGALAGLAALVAFWLRPHHPLETPLMREPQPSSSFIAPPPSASAPRLAPELEPCTPAVRAAGNSPLIDDFEDGDPLTTVSEHRAGFWNPYNDGSNVQRPAPGKPMAMERIAGGRGTSHFALHTSGGKFGKWGAVISTEFHPRRCYDASAYDGLTFWTRGSGSVNVVVKMTQVVPEEYGGSCLHDCYDGHRVTIALSRTWQEQRVTWAELKQRGFGLPLTFDPHSLLSLEFTVLPEQTPFDFWIDDVRFIER